MQTTTQTEPVIHRAPSGSLFVLPAANAHLIQLGAVSEPVSEFTLAAVFSRVTHGTPEAGIRWNPVTCQCEVFERGTVVFAADSVAACVRMGYEYPAVVVGPVAPLPDAIAQQEADPKDEPARGYEAPYSDADRPEDDYHAPVAATPARPSHSREPAVIAAARACHAARRAAGLANDEQAMKAALLAVTHKFTMSRTEWTASDYRELTREIQAGAFVPCGISSWQRVLFRTQAEIARNGQMERVA